MKIRYTLSFIFCVCHADKTQTFILEKNTYHQQNITSLHDDNCIVRWTVIGVNVEYSVWLLDRIEKK